MRTRATLVRLGLLAAGEPPRPAAARPVVVGDVSERPPLTTQRLRLRADLAYALAAVDGRRSVGAEDLATADRLAVRLLDRWNRPAAPDVRGTAATGR